MLFHVKTIVRDTDNIELACLKKAELNVQTFCHFLLWYLLHEAWSLGGHENTSS